MLEDISGRAASKAQRQEEIRCWAVPAEAPHGQGVSGLQGGDLHRARLHRDLYGLFPQINRGRADVLGQF